MRRREFIVGLGGALVSNWPIVGRAQQPTGRVYRVGYLSIASREQTLHFIKAFEEGLRSLGYRVGENVVIEYRFANGEVERLPALAAAMRVGTAHAHFFLGRYDEAASWAAMALQDNPDFQPGLRIDAASNAMAGRPEQAHKAMARLRQLNPALRVSSLKDVLGPYQHAEDLSRYEEALRQAGLPE
jgi:tetratricopeptide (TPR) repeat protein